ncbi:MAG TPA: SOS response-associated peptidase family protein [Allosphingosinicella sp.]|uniref:SOS response-associated peptidase n=1 Tax=Allosphingosinicella sp. TaxID=2823234 RepID=UPI002ED990AD
MCNRYRQMKDKVQLGALFNARPLTQDALPHGELFPKRPAAVIRVEGGERVIDVMTWGVPLQGKPITNVRNLQSPFWRNMLANPDRRCLVPVTSFCEWSGEKGSKSEHWFAMPSRDVFAFAGVWRPTEAGNAFAFLTCGYDGDPAAHVVGAIHPKACPVILHQEDEESWLGGHVDEVCALATPLPSQLLKVSDAPPD